jgi:ATP-dependent DNA helicase DinG
VFEKVMESLGLTPRDEQVRMLGHVRDVFDAPFTSTPIALIQAGTGTGKSYVILSEAVSTSHRSGLPSLVVCPNNTLINQYVLKDAPKIAEVTGARFEYIKGRGRYICANSNAIRGQCLGKPKSARLALFESVTLGGTDLEWAPLGFDKSWGCPGSRKCKRGSLCACGAKQNDEMENCTCPSACGILIARDRAATADVVITNAHVMVWDRKLRRMSDGAFGLLPEYGALFVDECHELEGIGRDVESDEIGHKSKVWDLGAAVARWRAGQIESMKESGESERHLDAEAESTKDLLVWAIATRAQFPDDTDEYELCDNLVRFLDPREGTIAVMQLQLEDSDPSGDRVVRSFVCQRRLINASAFFNDLLTSQPSVLASGTIPPSDRRRLGIRKTRIEYVGHPFDYSKSQLYIAPYDARDRADLGDRIRMTLKGIRAAQRDGVGTLVLFTSWADLDLVSQAIADDLGPDAPVWVQGREDDYQAAGTTLADDVREFAEAGSGVLCGVRSLFTGLDIPGSALGQVIVWKLPYQVPTAETKAVEATFGRSTYTDSMVMTLVQAIGRLVRTTEDTGRVMIMDERAKRLDFMGNPMMHHLSEFTRVGW